MLASLCFRKFAIFIMWSFIFRSFTFHPFSLLIHFTQRFLVSTKESSVLRLSRFRWSTLISSLFTVFVSSLHRSRDCLRLPAPAIPFGASGEMNFPLYYPLFPLHGHFCRFLSVRLLLRNVHLFLLPASICPSLYSRILFAIRCVSALLRRSCSGNTPFWRDTLRLLSRLPTRHVSILSACNSQG